MRKLVTWVAMTAVMALAGRVCAQEVSCRHFFMSASAKRICATPELMQLDQRMGALARRVGPHLASYKSDQKRFREALKSCQGDAACLENSYATRINELQAVVDALPPLSDEEAAELQKGAAKESKRLASQSDARAYWAKSLARQGALTQPVAQASSAQVPSEATPVASAASSTADEVQENGAVVAPSESVSNKLDQSVDINSAQSAPAASVQPMQVAKVPDQSGQPASDGFATWLVVTFWGTVIVLALRGLRRIWRRLRRAFKVCPKCSKWNAGKEIDRNSHSYTDYEMRYFTDTHYGRDRFTVTGRTTKKRQVKVRVTETVVKLKCKYCDNTWLQSSTRRAG